MGISSAALVVRRARTVRSARHAFSGLRYKVDALQLVKSCGMYLWGESGCCVFCFVGSE